MSTPPGCHAGRDGECSWKHCPQLRRWVDHCPLDNACPECHADESVFCGTCDGSGFVPHSERGLAVLIGIEQGKAIATTQYRPTQAELDALNAEEGEEPTTLDELESARILSDVTDGKDREEAAAACSSEAVREILRRDLRNYDLMCLIFPRGVKNATLDAIIAKIRERQAVK